MAAARLTAAARPLIAAQLAVSGAALAAVVWWALRQEAPPLPAGSGLAWVAVALAVYGLATAARAERWLRILRASEIAVRRRDAYPLVTVCYMGNNILPARAGDLLRVVLLAPKASRRRVLGTVVAERLLDAVALALVFVALAYGVFRDLDAGRAAVLAVLAAGAVGAVAAAAALRAPALTRLRAFLAPVWAASRDLAGRRGVGLLALSLVVWALEATVYLVVGVALDVRLDPLEAIYVVALTNLVALLPSAPGYVGTFDAAVLFAVGSLGYGGGDALGYLLLLRFVLFVPITLVGLAFFLGRYRGGAPALPRAG